MPSTQNIYAKLLEALDRLYAEPEELYNLQQRVTFIEQNGGGGGGGGVPQAVLNRITDNENDITSINSSLSTLSTQQGTNTSSIGTLNTTVSGFTSTINSLNSNVSSLSSSVSSLSTSVTANTNSITALDNDLTTAENSIDSIDTRLTTAEGTITTQGTSIGTLNSNLTSLTGRVTTAETDIINLETDVAAITSNVPLQVNDEGTELTAGATSLNFTGAGVTATNVGNAVTINVPGGSSGGGGGSASNEFIALRLGLTQTSTRVLTQDSGILDWNDIVSNTSSNYTYTASSGDITVVSAGIYLISINYFSGSLIGNDRESIGCGVDVNGTIVARTGVGSPNDNQFVFGTSLTCVASLSANSLVRLRGQSNITFNVSPNSNALIMKLA